MIELKFLDPEDYVKLRDLLDDAVIYRVVSKDDGTHPTEAMLVNNKFFILSDSKWKFE